MENKRLSIFKIGGNVINDFSTLNDFLTHFATFQGYKILVHGGGIRASEMLRKTGVTPKMIDGRRVTDKETLEIVTMVYAGLINKNIVATLQDFDCNALGLSGADANIVMSCKRPIKKVDYGFVGDVEQVDSDILKYLLDGGLTPVCCALTHDKSGQILNTNADTIAASLAAALSKYYQVDLWYLFEKQGVMRDVNDLNSLIEHIDSGVYEKLRDEGIISDGMLPKMENCYNALQSGVVKVKIAHPHILKNPIQKHTTLVL